MSSIFLSIYRLDYQTVEVMIADKELDRKTLNDTVDSQTGNTVNRFLYGDTV